MYIAGTKQLKGSIFFANTNRLCYICWRASCPCSKAILATKWLQKVDPALYQDYKNDIALQEGRSSEDKIALQKQIEKENEQILLQQKIELAKKRQQDDQETKKFVSIHDKSELANIAIEYCKKRHIPEEIYNKFYICHDGKYHDRLIIPFYTKDNHIEYFQGRTLKNLEPKYMNRCSAETHLYNRDFIDKSKPVFVLEGPIDSLFIENAVATCGAGSSAMLDKEIAEFPQVYYILDNDAAGNKKAGKLVRQHKNVFLWAKFLKDMGIGLKDVKDINDVMLKTNRISQFTYKDLKEYFTNITDEFLCYL